MRLKGKIAVVIGAGQTAGETIGNGRATSLLFAREGAKVVLVDRDPESVAETQSLIEAEGGASVLVEADATVEDDCRRIAAVALEQYGRIDILQYNAGIGRGDRELSELPEEDWDRIMGVNLTGAFLAVKHTLPVMREQGSGVITCISSVAAIAAAPYTAYKVSKAGLNALVHAIATRNAKYGIRCNAILPGLLDTPMAIEGHSQALGIDREELRKQRQARVPLRGRVGTAWDTAYASLFLASDEAGFITGVLLPVDGGSAARIGG